MTKPFKPLLSEAVEWDKVDWARHPWFASPKLDGIRCIVRDGVALSRKLIPIPNKHVQACIGRPEYEGLDGELLVGAWNDPDVYNATYRGVMKVEGEPDFTFAVFDEVLFPEQPYMQRMDNVLWRFEKNKMEHGLYVGQCRVLDRETFDGHEAVWTDEGFEGAMLRRGDAPYKFGRSTAKEGILLKVKDHVDFEAVVIGTEEEMHNGNEAVTDELGHTKRSSHQENKVGKGTLGAFILKALDTGVVFRSRGRLTKAQLQELWDIRDTLPGQLVKVRKMKHGEINAPRHPRVLEVTGLRHPIDM